MRSRVRQIIVFFFLALLTCCQRDKIDPTLVLEGSLNGTSWQRDGWTFKGGVYRTKGFNTTFCNLGTLDILLTHHNPQGYGREHLFIAKIPPRLGIYPVRNFYDCDVNADVGAQFYLLGADGDVLTAVFDVVESADNKLVVERIDSSARQLTGRLQVTLAAGPKQRSSSTPYDTVRITDCRFTLPFENR